MDDHALVDGMLAGHETAFEEFFDMYYPRLFRFALRRVGDEDAAEDVVQASLIAGIRGLPTWRGDASLFTWLCSVCRREALAFNRRLGRQAIPAIDDDPALRGQL